MQQIISSLMTFMRPQVDEVQGLLLTEGYMTEELFPVRLSAYFCIQKNMVQRSSTLKQGSIPAVIVTDEFQFSVNIKFRRTFIWRNPGIRYQLSKFLERAHYGTVDLSTWIGSMLDWLLPHPVFVKGSVAGVMCKILS